MKFAIRHPFASVVAAALALSAASGISSPAHADPAPCAPRATGHYASYEAVVVQTVNLKAQPASECANVSTLTSGGTFWVWCMSINYYGNYWFYGRKGGTASTMGWTSGANLNILLQEPHVYMPYCNGTGGEWS